VTQRNNLYRRSSGIYVLRITVPARYRVQLGQREIHASTQTTDHSAAKAVALHLLARWHSCMGELNQVNETKVIEGSPLLTGAGFISIQDFCETFEVAAELVLQEILNNNIFVACRLNAQSIYWVDDYTRVDREGEKATDGFVLNSAFAEGRQQTFTGYLKPFHRTHTISNLIEFGFSDETAFRFKTNTLAAAFCDLPGIRLTKSSVFITKVQAERIRAPWVKVLEGKAALLAAALTPASTILTPPSTSPIFEARFCNPKFSKMLSSDLLHKFFEHKMPEWGLDQQKKMTTLCGCFVELMSDPQLGTIDREFIRQYESKLKRMPANRHLAARRHKTNDPTKLLDLADQNDEPRLSAQTVDSYLSKLSELFRWAVTEDYFSKNPAENISQRARGAKKRAQDDRDQFDQKDLNKIFSAEWFQLGGAKRNKAGGLSSFRPYYYWLPLLGLHCGARINEISQLYLDDIIEYDAGKFYIDITDTTPDSADTKNPIKASDKSIKNPNSKRVIPIHSMLIKLGLTDYIQALKTKGEERLFPELIHDEVKGYGKAAGRWFNEHLLGKQLKFERNGMKAYHSFRHTFITSLIDKATPEYIISAIVGHERGETTSLKRYGKDAAKRLHPYIESLDFELPAIQPFKIAEGIVAIKQALHRRRPRS
jgi:integrase